jgi:hypothetical protein
VLAPAGTIPGRGGVAQGQSKRLIIAESVVRVHPPLLEQDAGADAPASCGSTSWFDLRTPAPQAAGCRALYIEESHHPYGTCST